MGILRAHTGTIGLSAALINWLNVIHIIRYASYV